MQGRRPTRQRIYRTCTGTLFERTGDHPFQFSGSPAPGRASSDFLVGSPTGVLLPQKLALLFGVDLLHAFHGVDSFQAVAEHHHVVLVLLLDDHADVGSAVVLALTLCLWRHVLEFDVRVEGERLDRHHARSEHQRTQFLDFHLRLHSRFVLFIPKGFPLALEKLLLRMSFVARFCFLNVLALE